MMNIADICQRHIVTIDAVATLRDAASRMREHHVGSLVVTSQSGGRSEVVGVLTDRDLAIEALARGLAGGDLRVGQIASRQLVAVPEMAGIPEALAAMKQAGVRRLLVTAPGGELSGILAADDLLAALSDQLAGLAQALKSGIARETAQRGAVAPPAARPTFLPHGTPGMQQPVGLV
jgi:CBS domain-containing protein